MFNIWHNYSRYKDLFMARYSSVLDEASRGKLDMHKPAAKVREQVKTMKMLS
ncbi:hypothetical protein P153DRAFT_231669 [Dothidotthia symphoricarpi CBS 119687]|uniref:Uncharacterized protein n=1 Tax=Dothidotthia symphoricarpi CBS 119687 TaxID=1392245 RepID=A0A6A6AEB5_9PLEO|nr:uncharacterized protein P153DRAFT_231669 [Dothidotthia symphoricarpi CBS 119687]KAF2130150.1 hypothetical protein P153DRAFT_231669 [Dothidotthia symphoricarpi CBS 119687]